MKGCFDMERGRVLVFCNAEHARQQMTKDGHFRLRPKRAKQWRRRSATSTTSEGAAISRRPGVGSGLVGIAETSTVAQGRSAGTHEAAGW
jgi:hypothetical protein